jgi:catechol 2,3-dioxygenase-like lactoylglutathione lyase family enzyme
VACRFRRIPAVFDRPGRRHLVEALRFREVLDWIGSDRDCSDFPTSGRVAPGGRRPAPPTQNLHLCFYTREKEHVDAFHRAGVEAGFRSNGEPGYRDYDTGYYAAYLLDPDGNNIEALYRDVGNIGHDASPTLR